MMWAYWVANGFGLELNQGAWIFPQDIPRSVSNGCCVDGPSVLSSTPIHSTKAADRDHSLTKHGSR